MQVKEILEDVKLLKMKIDFGYKYEHLNGIAKEDLLLSVKNIEKHLSESKEENQEVDAYCPNCDAYIVNQRVTFEECCVTCDRYCKSIEEKPTAKSVEFIDLFCKEFKISGLDFDENYTTQYGYLYEAFESMMQQHKESEASELLHNSNIEKLRATKSNGEWRRLLIKILESKQK